MLFFIIVSSRAVRLASRLSLRAKMFSSSSARKRLESAHDWSRARLFKKKN
ncbi:hypothetical protein HanRHA438_Chr14g0632851 [Helianthus annuus]|nr:hypothetical protein HanRHA438_Chr14g0632851 [Helianthus annuus]